MKKKEDVLKFLEDNHTMIDSLMSKEEMRKFNYSVVKIISDDIKRQIKQEREVSECK